MTLEKEGILLVNKPSGRTSFSLVAAIRRRLGVKKVGHAGTLDPFATGVMILLVGRDYTRLSDSFLGQDKEYRARILLGVSTDSFDCDGQVQERSDVVPTIEEIEKVVAAFQGEIDQVPPMFSAKKINGQKLCDLARKGKVVDRLPSRVKVETQIIHYEYPYLDIRVKCSKGTYIRSIAHEIGIALGSFGHLIELQRTQSGKYALSECFDGNLLDVVDYDLRPHLRKMA